MCVLQRKALAKKNVYSCINSLKCVVKVSVLFVLNNNNNINSKSNNSNNDNSTKGNKKKFIIFD